jgi:hypothetical protein
MEGIYASGGREIPLKPPIPTDSDAFALVDTSGSTGYSNNQFDNNGGNANPQVSGRIEMGTNVYGGDRESEE